MIIARPINITARPVSYRIIAAASIGNALEWFDILVYGYFAVTVTKLFFPADNEIDSLLLGLGTFGAAYLPTDHLSGLLSYESVWLFTALNLLPSMATLALVRSPSLRQSSTNRAQTLRMAGSLRKSAITLSSGTSRAGLLRGHASGGHCVCNRRDHAPRDRATGVLIEAPRLTAGCSVADRKLFERPAQPNAPGNAIFKQLPADRPPGCDIKAKTRSH
jgi:hypothetical protein